MRPWPSAIGTRAWGVVLALAGLAGLAGTDGPARLGPSWPRAALATRAPRRRVSCRPWRAAVGRRGRFVPGTEAPGIGAPSRAPGGRGPLRANGASPSPAFTALALRPPCSSRASPATWVRGLRVVAAGGAPTTRRGTFADREGTSSPTSSRVPRDAPPGRPPHRHPALLPRTAATGCNLGPRP